MSKSRRLESGMSLPEVIVVSLLFLIAMSMIAALFASASRSTRSGEARTDLTSKRAEIASKLRQAMMSSYQSGNSVFYRSPGQEDLVLTLISSKKSDGSRDWKASSQRPVFHGYEVFYREQTDDSLRWLRIERPATEVAEPLSESEVRARLSPADLKLAGSVTAFRLYSPYDGSVRQSWANPLGLRIVQETDKKTPVTTELAFKFLTL